MTINPEIIERFLRQRPKPGPDTKNMPIADIDALVRQHIGTDMYFKTEPRLSQYVGVAFALIQRRALLFHGMRTGKTKLCLDWAANLRRAGLWRGKGLVMVPAPVLLAIWQTQAHRHTDLKTAIVGTREDQLIQAIESDADLVISSWTGLQMFCTVTRKSKKGDNKRYINVDICQKFAQHFTLSIIDEIHMFGNPDGLPFKIAKEFTQACTFRVGCTGTPFGRDPFRIWAQTYLIDEGQTLGRNFHFFSTAFGMEEPIFFRSPIKKWVFDRRRLPTLKSKLAGISQSYERREFEEGVQRNVVELTMSGDQRDAYWKAMSEVIQYEGSDIQIKSAFIRTRQIASGFVKFADTNGQERVIKFENNIKLDWLKNLLTEIGDIQFIIFHEFTVTGEMICDELKKMKIKYAWLHGGVAGKGAIIEKFRTGEIQATVVQSAAGGMGIELAAADYVLFFESPLDSTLRNQAEMRALGEARGGRPLEMDDLTCSTVEKRVLEMIKDGQDVMTKAIFDRSLWRDAMSEFEK